MSPRTASRSAAVRRPRARAPRRRFPAALRSQGVVAIIVAAGRGDRLAAGTPKAFVDLCGISILRRSAEALATSEEVSALIIVAPPGFEAAARQETVWSGKLRAVVSGGATRQESVRAGLRKTTPRDRIVLVHDAARPFVDGDLVARVIEAARLQGAAIPVAPVVDTIKRITRGRIGETVDRETLGAAQTPQAFDRAALVAAYVRASRAGVALTDEAMAMEREGHPVAAVAGSPQNFKITTQEDLDRARKALGPRAVGLRVGQGFDVHRLKPGKRLMLGGVHVPAAVGLEGHSDGDVLLHALCDALLGAVAEGEIGALFPSSDRSLRGASSSRFVHEALARVARAQFSIVNVDATLIAERPRLSGHLSAIQKKVASLLRLEPGQVSIKVKSADALGALGRGEGIAAQALVLLARS